MTSTESAQRIVRSLEEEAEFLRVENERLQNELSALRNQLETLETLADTDTLTPLPNRRCFLRELDRVIRHVARYNTGAAILFIDVDGLKHINDDFGHCTGDHALIHVATLLRSTLRSTDVVARIGGDEFGLLLDPIDAADVQPKIETLRQSVNTTALHVTDRAVRLNISIGATMIQVGDGVESVLTRADAAMYRDKRDQRWAK